jgi:hypothetical protein
MAMEMAQVLIPGAMFMVTGINTVSPTDPFATPMAVRILLPPTTGDWVTVIVPVVLVVVPEIYEIEL